MRSANVVGLGLIGGSLCAALGQRGWSVHGNDVEASRVEEAREKGLIIDSVLDQNAEITFESARRNHGGFARPDSLLWRYKFDGKSFI